MASDTVSTPSLLISPLSFPSSVSWIKFTIALCTSNESTSVINPSLLTSPKIFLFTFFPVITSNPVVTLFLSIIFNFISPAFSSSFFSFRYVAFITTLPFKADSSFFDLIEIPSSFSVTFINSSPSVTDNFKLSPETNLFSLSYTLNVSELPICNEFTLLFIITFKAVKSLASIDSFPSTLAYFFWSSVSSCNLDKYLCNNK